MENKQLTERLVFNPNGDDSQESRQIIGGNSTGIANLNSVKYKWAVSSAKIMVNNFWVPEKVSLVEDKATLKELTDDEMVALKNTLSFLIALDSMQTTNLPRLGNYITAPEVAALFTIQEYQEYIHSQSYQYILQELFPSTLRDEIYNYWRTNPILLKRNQFIASKYQGFIDNPTDETFKQAVVADFVLEGIYFYNGFQFFYQLAARQKLPDTSKVIRYIESDEVTHVAFMSNILKEIIDLSNEDDRKLIIDTITEAVDQEIEYSKEVYGDRILGMSNQSSEAYVKFLGNKCAKIAGVGVIYKGFNSNPYEFLSTEKRENFFETTVTEYSQSTAISGWDDF